MQGKAMIKRKRTEVPKSLQSIDVKAILRKRGMYLKQRQNLQLKQAALPLAKMLVKSKKKSVKVGPSKYVSFSDVDAAEYQQKMIHNVETLEKHFNDALQKFIINHVLVKALDKLHGIVEAHKSIKAQKKALVQFMEKDIFDDTESDDLMNQAQINFDPLLQNMAVIAGQDANKLIGINDPYIPSDNLRKRVQTNVEKFTKSMIDTDQAHLTDLITEGIQSGDSVQQIRSAITDNFSSYSTMQAQRITRTEVLRAANQSTLDAFKQSGVVEGQQWLTAGADDECADYDGEVETLDNGFYDAGDDPFLDGEPPLHPNCRCVLIPVLSDS